MCRVIPSFLSCNSWKLCLCMRPSLGVYFIEVVLLVTFARTGYAAAIQRGEPLRMSTALIIVNESHADDVLSQVGQFVKVTQRLPPRLAIVEGEDRQLEAVRTLPGVIAVCEGPVPDSVLQQLHPAERLFADGWAAGRQPKTARPGEGLPWDAEGFQPPDLPNERSEPK
jgi:hypothetical protein